MEPVLLMLLLGCRPPGRNTEQHDVFFGIGVSIRDLIPAIKKSWPEAKGIIHIDAWRTITRVDGYAIKVTEITADAAPATRESDLFFINLGGYIDNEFDEFHYKMLVVAMDLEEAKARAKKSAFFKHSSVGRSANTPNATAHIDDKFGVDVDDAYKLQDILPAAYKERYRIGISEQPGDNRQDELHLGYFRLQDL